MRWMVAVALLARSAAADPGVDYERARLHALTARNLAHDGHCAEALALRSRIEQLDAEVARVAYTEDPMLVACANDPRLGPPSLTPVAVPAPPPTRSCSTRAYLEPSLLFLSDGNQPSLYNRAAAGVLIRDCASVVQVRLGATAFIGHVGDIGAGLEFELNNAVSDDLRLGAHAAYESASGGAVASVDLRLHYEDVVWLQAGGYHWSHGARPTAASPSASASRARPAPSSAASSSASAGCSSCSCSTRCRTRRREPMRSPTTLFVASSLLVAPLRAHADPVDAAKEPPTPPAPLACGQLGAYIEPSIFAAAGTPGFGVLARYALGVRLIDCAKDGHEGFVVRVGGTFSLRTDRLGFGPPSGASAIASPSAARPPRVQPRSRA